ncbi:MAG: PAS domain S-box protein [Desulfobacterales bacterium]|nr:PAS domain S-box protein [Desulfobacterales bacterium]
MKFSTKLSLAILSTGIIALVIFSFVVFRFSSEEVIKSQFSQTKSIANEVADDLDHLLAEKVKTALTLANTPIIKNALGTSNFFYTNLSDEKRKESIKLLNEQWKSTKDPTDKFIQKFTENKASHFLKNQQSVLKGEYGEIFLTNKFGALVASTSKLSTFAHGHKYWWLGSYSNGVGAVFFDDRGYDESVGGYVLGLVVPIRKDKEVIGILKCNLNILGNVSKLIIGAEDKLIGKFQLIRSGGMVVFEEGFEPLSTQIHDDIFQKIKNKNNEMLILNDSGEKYLVGFSEVNMTKGKNGYGFGGTFESIDHKKGNTGESWYILCYRKVSIARAPMIELIKWGVIVGIVIILILVLVSHLFAKKIAKPLLILDKATRKIGKGDFEYKIELSQKDEFGTLAHSFNSMTTQLTYTTTSIKLLENEIITRKQAEDMLREKTMYLDNILRSATEYAIATTDLNFCITYYNPLAEKFFGYTADKVIGKTVQEMHTREHVDSKLFDKAIEIIRTQGEYYYRVKQEIDTGTRYLDSRVSGIYDNASNLVGFALFSHDITSSIEAEQKLKYSKLQLEAVFNNLDSIIYITDMDSYEVLYMSNYMKEAFGKDLTGKICWESIHENQDGPCDFCTNDKLIDDSGNPKEPYVWEFYNPKLNRWYELHDQAIPWTDGRLVRMEIAFDITERKFSEIAVQRRERYLEALNNSSQLLLIPSDKPPFQEIVNLIGPPSSASRVYIFINHHSSDGNLLTSHKAEWCAKGITPEINNPVLQNMSYDALVPRLKETLQQGDFYKGCVADFPDNEREILEPQGIISILIIPIMLDDEFVGFMGFDNCVSEYEWDSVDQTFLGTAAVGVGQAINRTHSENTIRNSLDEKVVLLREIHHRVKNNMQVIISLLRMHGRRTNDANLSKIFEDCRDRINAMSLIHESLYQSDNLAKIDFKVYIKKLCRNLGQAYGVSGKGISLAVGECDVALDMDQGIAIGMVIAELISNAFKHAFPLGKGGNVSINLSELDAENVKLIIKDDGKGMPPKIDIMNSPSLGLRLAVSAVTLELGGSIEIDRDKGTQYTICFKYKRK